MVGDNVKKNVLIATLGETPSVVTEALDFLRENNVSINEVVLLTTIDANAEASANFLTNYVNSNYGISTYSVYPQVKIYEDIDSEEAVLEFMKLACGQLRDMRKRGENVYVSIAGGRKTMSALMTLAVQIYGAKEQFHIIVDDPELEEKSKINKLMHLRNEDKKKVLHPDRSKVKVVHIPFIGLFPFIKDIVAALQGKEVGSREIKELLISNNLIENNKPTELGKMVLEILESVESLPEPCLHEPEIKLSKKEPKFIKELEKRANEFKDRFHFVCRIMDAKWRRGKPKVKIEKPDKIRVFISTGRGFNYSLILLTTAKTDGELEAAKREVEKFLETIT